MATLTTSVVCLCAIHAIFVMDITVADPEIDINPIEIRLGISSTLDINCTISLKNYPDMAALVSLNLLWANTSGQDFQELAVITEFSPDSVNLMTQDKITATGVLNETGESFLHALWEYPTATQGGVYQCVAHGVDVLGHCVELTNTSIVTVDEANLDDIVEKLKQIETHEKSMENTISSLESTLANNTYFMENKVSSLENTIASMENTRTSMENHIQTLENTVASLTMWRQGFILDKLDLIGTYQDKEYYVSRLNFQDVNESASVCKSSGGTLIEIDDQNEYNAIVGFLKTVNSDITHIIIGGTDEQYEGNWVLPSTNKPLPYTAWYTNDPGVTRSLNCVGMYKNYSWKMYDEYCNYKSPYADRFFTCEIPAVGHTGQKK